MVSKRQEGHRNFQRDDVFVNIRAGLPGVVKFFIRISRRLAGYPSDALIFLRLLVIMFDKTDYLNAFFFKFLQ